MTSDESNLSERLSPTVRAAFESYPKPHQDALVECIKYLRAHPEPDGEIIFDVPMYPIMFRTMKCHGYFITFRVQDHKALIHAIVPDDGEDES